MAAKHEIEQMQNFENGRLLFQKSLRVNKTSKELWHEYFRAELLHVDKIKKRKKLLLEGGLELQNEEEPEPERIEDFLSNKTAEIVFSSAIKVIWRSSFTLHSKQTSRRMNWYWRSCVYGLLFSCKEIP